MCFLSTLCMTGELWPSRFIWHQDIRVTNCQSSAMSFIFTQYSFCNSFIHGLLGSWNFERMFTPLNISHVMCHVSHVRQARPSATRPSYYTRGALRTRGGCRAWMRQSHHFFSFFLDKSRNLSKFVSVLLSASVERFNVSRMRDFFNRARLHKVENLIATSIPVPLKGTKLCPPPPDNLPLAW